MMTGKRRYQELFFAVMFVVITVLIWRSLLKKKSLQEHAKCLYDADMLSRKSSGSDYFSPALFELKPGYPGCSPRKICPADHFPFFLRSGAANMVGPKICFNNMIILSGGQNNVGWGVNIVIVDGETGMILRSDFFKVQSKGLHDFLKKVQNGNIVLVASYEDPTVQLTDEVRKLFAEMGSSMVFSVKYRDNWVFAGAVGLNKGSPFEKLIVNDKKTNAYGDWPEIGELDGCFPRKV